MNTKILIITVLMFITGCYRNTKTNKYNLKILPYKVVCLEKIVQKNDL